MKIVCIGEMLIDFVCTDTNMGLVKGQNYIKKSGGAPANVAACIGKLGGSVALVGAVGKDPFGQFLTEEVQAYHVDTQHLVSLPCSTTLAFVSLSDDGEREFAFNRGADEKLTLDAASINALTSNTIVHLGSATALLGGALGESYLSLAQAAKQKGNIICFDPNYRIDLWQGNEAQFSNICSDYFKMADIVKVSEEELVLLSKQSELSKGCEYLHDFGVKIVLVTLGGEGCLISQNGKVTQIPAYEIKVVDTTGAGDSFIGAILYKISQSSPKDDFFASEMPEFVAFAGKVSGLVCSKIGAMSALPTLSEVESMSFSVKR